MTRSPLFWFVAGVGTYFVVQHFTGFGKTGKTQGG